MLCCPGFYIMERTAPEYAKRLHVRSIHCEGDHSKLRRLRRLAMVAAGEGQSFPSYSSSAPELWLKLQPEDMGAQLVGKGWRVTRYPSKDLSLSNRGMFSTRRWS